MICLKMHHDHLVCMQRKDALFFSAIKYNYSYLRKNILLPLLESFRTELS